MVKSSDLPTPLRDATLTSPATPSPSYAFSTVTLPMNVLRADQLFFEGLTAMAVLPFLLIAFCSLYQARRSHLYHRQIQILEKLWLTPPQSPPLP